MKITHVLRAEEHLSNTIRQLMLFEVFDYPVPLFGHMSLILGTDRQKLSKRHGATSCHEYKTLGYLSDALKNFVALLGWSSPKGQEIMCQAEMIEQFTLDRFTLSPAVFDEVKLKWMNATHLRALSNHDLWEHLKPILAAAGIKTPEDTAWIDKSIHAFKSSIETLNEAIPYYQLVSEGVFEVYEDSKETLAWEPSKNVIHAWKEKLSVLSDKYLTEELFLKTQDAVKEATGAKGKNLFMPIRCAIIGKPHGTELKLIVPLIPRSELVRRAEVCLATMG
jgi:nondiscriminating glutamyl-tRNA synthetase